MPTGLHTIRVDTGRDLARQLPIAGSLAAVKVDVLNVEGVDMAGDVPEHCQCDVDEQVCSTAGNEKHADGWDCKSLVSINRLSLLGR